MNNDYDKLCTFKDTDHIMLALPIIIITNSSICAKFQYLRVSSVTQTAHTALPWRQTDKLKGCRDRFERGGFYFVWCTKWF